MPDDLVVTSSVRIPRHEIDVSFTTSGGPGASTPTRRRLESSSRLDLTSSSAFSRVQRERVTERLGDEIRVIVDDERSQVRNRALAEERLVARLQSALHVQRQRRKTKPTRGSKERRITAKKQRGEKKRLRRSPSRHD